jgi:hypothetical protein
MPAAQPVVLTTRSFLKQADAIEFFKAMLARYDDGARVGHEDEIDLRALLTHHPERSDKVRTGIDHFKVDQNTLYIPITRCFWIVYPDESVDDFNFRLCIRHAAKR